MRPAILVPCALLLAVLAAGCGGSKKVELVLRPRITDGHQPTAADVGRSVPIVERRARLLDPSAEVRQHGADEILVRLAGAARGRATRVLTGRGVLAFYDLESDLAAPSVRADGRARPFESLRALLRAAHRRKLPPDRTVITCDRSEATCPGVGKPAKTFYYLFKYEPNAPKPIPELTGNAVVPSETRADFDPQTNEPVVLIRLTEAGADRFRRITAREARRGRSLWQRAHASGAPDNYFQSFAIVLDRKLESFPTIDFQQYPDGISGANGIQIVGLPSESAAKNLANVLQTGALPVGFSVVSK